jgi:hypothetical protein
MALPFQESTFQPVLLDLSFPDIPPGESVTKTLRMARELAAIAFVNDGKSAGVVEALGGGARPRFEGMSTRLCDPDDTVRDGTKAAHCR